MTCIVGLVDKGKVWLGGDSAGSDGWTLETRTEGKVWQRGGFVFGFTSSFRMGQLLRYSLKIPHRGDDGDLMDFMVCQFIDAVRSCLKDGGFASRDKETESGGVFLVGCYGRLFKVESDYQVGEMANGYTACGCGEKYAIGAMAVTQKMPARQRLKLALETAQTHSAGVRGPFHIECLE